MATKVTVAGTPRGHYSGAERSLPKGWVYGRIRGFVNILGLRVGDIVTIFPETGPIPITLTASDRDVVDVQEVDVELVVVR